MSQSPVFPFVDDHEAQGYLDFVNSRQKSEDRRSWYVYCTGTCAGIEQPAASNISEQSSVESETASISSVSHTPDPFRGTF